MRIALLTDGIAPFVTGGMQRHSFHLARNLLKLGVHLTLFHTVPHGKKPPTDKEVAEALEAPEGLLRVIFIPFPKSGRFPGHYVKESYLYSCAIHESMVGQWGEFDFIYAKGFTAWCLLEFKKTGIHMAPIGVKFHGYEMFQRTRHLKSKLSQFMFRSPVVYINRGVNVVFSYGGEITEVIKKIGVPEERIVNIGSGIDDSWIVDKPIPQNGIRRFLFIGRYERRKGIEDLLRCAEEIKNAKIEFHWIGPIPKEKRLSGAGHIYHGEIREAQKLRDIIDKCQVLVVPSHSEGMPNVILEAMARGLAVISTQVGAVPMLVDDTNGVLIKPRDVKSLRREIKRFAQMPEATLSLLRQESIRKVYKDFRWSAIAKQTLGVIRKVTYSAGMEME